MRRTRPLWTLAVLLAGAQALAAPPMEFSVQGVLRDGSGALQSAAVNVSVSLFDAPTAGNKLAGPYTQNGVAVTNGLFTVTIAEATLPAIVAAAPALWLEVTVGTDVFARQKVTPTMLAAQSADSARLGGVAAASFQRTLATPDCGAGKHLQAIAPGGAVTCVADPTADGTSLGQAGSVLSVNFGGTGSAATAARSDHTHGLNCTQRFGTANNGSGTTQSASYAACNAGEVITGGGCSGTANVTVSNLYDCRGILCLCLVGRPCPPTGFNYSWQCISSTTDSVTASAICCTIN